jgi:3-dehydroquinate synthase
MPHIYLYGPPGTGKSTIGKLLASNLDLTFVDLDRLIEMRANMPIPDIMATKGEVEFRDHESSALRALASWSESVIALGGGALLREENRLVAEENGSVVLLTASLETLLERVNQEPKARPLLAGDAQKKLPALLEKRQEHYESFPLKVRVDGLTPAQGAEQIQVLLGRFHLSAMAAYDALVGSVAQIGDLCNKREVKNPVIVTDENVATFHAEAATTSLGAAGYEPKVIVLPAGEAHKNLETVNRLWREFLSAGLDRKSAVIALGGGVIGDMAGFAASTYMRGVDWIGLPTSLLAMVDASLGGKTGFDLPEGKNLIGSFHPPRLVLADPGLLSTLPEAEFISGMAEVVKHGVISDPELFDLCKRGLDWARGNVEQIVKRAMAVKIHVIEEDPYEKGFRAALNLGHTVGHAVESVSKFSLRHGEAIAIGMVAEAKYAQRVGLARAGLVEALTEVLSGLGLPVAIPEDLAREEIIRTMRVDKKKSSKAIRFALPAEIGHVELTYVDDLESVLED